MRALTASMSYGVVLETINLALAGGLRCIGALLSHICNFFASLKGARATAIAVDDCDGLHLQRTVEAANDHATQDLGASGDQWPSKV